MNNAQSITLVTGWMDLAIKILPVFGLLLVVWLVMLRTRSLHFLKARLWWVVAGKLELHDAYLQEHWLRVNDVEKIRYITGIQFRCPRAAAEVFRRAERHGVPTQDLLAASAYFDPKHGTIKDPRYGRNKKILAPIVLLLMALVTGSLLLSSAETVLLKIKKTDTWLLAKPGEVKILGSDRTAILSTDCALTESGSHDMKVICEILMQSEEELNAFIKKQRRTLVVLAIIMGFIVAYMLSMLEKMKITASIMHAFQSGPPKGPDTNHSL